MKGHVGGGLRDLWRYQGVAGVVSIKLFSYVLHVSIRDGFYRSITSMGSLRICAERLLDVMLAGEGIPPWLVGDINLRV